MKRTEYLVRAREFQPRGSELAHAKLTEDDIQTIRSAVRQREALRKHIREFISNEALARRFGVHLRTIEKVVQRDTWSHIDG